jgi:hypothetical protein
MSRGISKQQSAILAALEQHGPHTTWHSDDDVVEAIAEVLREPGARLAGDSWFFAQRVAPLYARYGEAAVDAALRQIHGDIRRRAASEISALRMNAARLKREIERP